MPRNGGGYRAEGDHAGAGHEEGVDQQLHADLDGTAALQHHLIEGPAHHDVQRH